MRYKTFEIWLLDWLYLLVAHQKKNSIISDVKVYLQYFHQFKLSKFISCLIKGSSYISSKSVRVHSKQPVTSSLSRDVGGDMNTSATGLAEYLLTYMLT